MPYQPTLGQIMPVAFNSPIPNGWHLCDGTLLPLAQNQALFALFGTTYGGNGTTTFALPDLRGRAIVGAQNTNGQQSGTTTVTITDAQMPSHNHMWSASTTPGTLRIATPANNLFGVNTIGSTPAQVFAVAGSMETPLATGTNVAPAGGGGAHNNVQPYIAINYMVALVGVFPSRL